MMTKLLNTLNVLLLAIAIALAGGCADRKNPNDPAGKVHPDNWMQETSEDFHGQKIATVGLISCSQCHGEDYKGGTSGKSCYECHDGPSGHPVNYLTTSSSNFHGNVVASEGTESCTACHGDDYKGKEHGGPSCYTCHNGPSGHPVNSIWMTYADPGFHGLAAANRGLSDCARCHGDNFEGGTSGQSCKECHATESGHPSESDGFLDHTSPNFHGDRYDLRGEAYCAACHGADLRGGYTDVTCYDCHNGPSGHPDESEGFLDPASPNFHGLEASSRGLAECATCHGADFTGGSAGRSCFECHDGPSGHPETTVWMDPANENFHGERLIETGLDYCAGCHGDDFTGGYAQVSCFTCHDGPSGHPADGWLDKTNANFHGLQASEEGLDHCAQCHGADFTGGLSGQSCFECHDGPSGHPDETVWLDSSNVAFHGARLVETGLDYCAGCHGDDFRGGTSGQSCYECHNGPSGHPETGWFDPASESFHGLAASSRGLPACAVCHGDDFEGGISGQSCKVCHPTQSGHPASGWLDQASDNFHANQVALHGPEFCAGCHGADYTGGDAGVSCFTCHDGPSGHPATGWLSPSSTNFHGLSASSRGLSDCARCHGADFEGGVSGQSCKVCHATQSGHPTTGWLDDDSSNFHGDQVEQRGPEFCAGCHGADYMGGDTGFSCFLCHGDVWLSGTNRQ